MNTSAWVNSNKFVRFYERKEGLQRMSSEGLGNPNQQEKFWMMNVGGQLFLIKSYIKGDQWCASTAIPLGN